MNLFKKIILKILGPILNRLSSIENQLAINKALNKGVMGAITRKIDSSNPISWEFSGLSQNGEDGITSVLISNLKNQNKYFIEIGAGDGITTNTGWLAIVKNYSGIMIDGGEKSIETAKNIKHGIGVEYFNKFIDLNNCKEIQKISKEKSPDVFSIDIDGNDFYIMKELLENDFSPKIIIVEYNSCYGPENSLTVKYNPKFNFYEAHPTFLYYGVSITGWKNLFNSYNYEFVTVDSNGVNAFFIKKSEFRIDFIKNLKGLKFQENFYQKKKFNNNWEKQFELIKKLDFQEI